MQALITTAGTAEVLALLERAVNDFNAVTCHNQPIPAVGIVGEIYLKYNEFSNADIFDWLVKQGV